MIKPDNIARRYMNPALAKAGLPQFRLHDLRQTFGSLLIQDGASLAYGKDQMGHSSIQVTLDIYGHLVPSANIAYAERLATETSLHQSTPGTHQTREGSKQQLPQVIENRQPGNIYRIGRTDVYRNSTWTDGNWQGTVLGEIKQT